MVFWLIFCILICIAKPKQPKTALSHDYGNSTLFFPDTYVKENLQYFSHVSSTTVFQNNIFCCTNGLPSPIQTLALYGSASQLFYQKVGASMLCDFVTPFGGEEKLCPLQSVESLAYVALPSDFNYNSLKLNSDPYKDWFGVEVEHQEISDYNDRYLDSLEPINQSIPLFSAPQSGFVTGGEDTMMCEQNLFVIHRNNSEAESIGPGTDISLSSSYIPSCDSSLVNDYWKNVSRSFPSADIWDVPRSSALLTVTSHSPYPAAVDEFSWVPDSIVPPKKRLRHNDEYHVQYFTPLSPNPVRPLSVPGIRNGQESCSCQSDQFPSMEILVDKEPNILYRDENNFRCSMGTAIEPDTLMMSCNNQTNGITSSWAYADAKEMDWENVSQIAQNVPIITGQQLFCSYAGASLNTPLELRRELCETPYSENYCPFYQCNDSFASGSLLEDCKSPSESSGNRGKKRSSGDTNDSVSGILSSGISNGIPGVYFDRRKKGFRIRFQNIYVGWVALSRYPSYEEAYAVAEKIWDDAVLEATRHQDKQAAVNAGIPLQIQSRLKIKNPGGRPRTVSRLSPQLDAKISAAVDTAKHDKASAS